MASAIIHASVHAADCCFIKHARRENDKSGYTPATGSHQCESCLRPPAERAAARRLPRRWQSKAKSPAVAPRRYALPNTHVSALSRFVSFHRFRNFWLIQQEVFQRAVAYALFLRAACHSAVMSRRCPTRLRDKLFGTLSTTINPPTLNEFSTPRFTSRRFSRHEG